MMDNDIYRVVVCIKPVKSSLLGQESSNEPYQINPYDLMALENLVKIKKETRARFVITCLCMGPKKAEDMMRKALAIGADEALLLNDNAFIGSDTVATSYIISTAIKKLNNVRLIVCGERTIDGETGQVPAGLSERLNYKSIVEVNEIVGISAETLTYKKSEGASVLTSKVKLPTVISYRELKTTAPLISLLSLKRSKSKKIELWDINDIEIDESQCGLKGSKTKVLEVKNEFIKKVKNEFSKNENALVQGSTEDKVKLIMEIVKGNTIKI
ncbi:MAG: hypothetical protein UIM53_09265 [Acutalibacteraceae bacterium]|nr:hypothetical protein [Acutalibacteraceae bacterium]